VIDDPHKPDEAKSETVREGVIEWFQNTLESRQNYPGNTPIILIMQRLHERDLAGWLLDGGNGEEWEHICFTAIQPNGEALWSAKHTLEDLRRMEQAAPYVFSGQYMQRPSPAEGGLFKPDQLKIIDAIPAGEPIQWVRGWDLASTTTGDWTAGVRVGKMLDGRFIISDIVRIRSGPDERDAAIVNTCNLDGARTKVSIPQDPGQAGKTQVLYLTRTLAGHRVHSSPESGDKVTRAEPVAAQINVGNVMMLRGSWNESFINELRLFPNGVNDDQVDALSRAFSLLIGKGIMTIDDNLLRRRIA
jgi:predicted phage terminase large subunit-like protein